MRTMSEEIEDLFFKDVPKERPFECSECKKNIRVRYTEVDGETVTNTAMCADCPELQKRLHGLSKEEIAAISNPGEGLCCGNCGTTLEAIKTGHPLGCSICYEVFQDLIFQNLLKEGRIPQRLMNQKPQETLHIGKYPSSIKQLSPSVKLVALNDALKETLAKEDYEQAALIRDQIKKLTEGQPDV
jgi:protein arginine kinase activator